MRNYYNFQPNNAEADDLANINSNNQRTNPEETKTEENLNENIHPAEKADNLKKDVYLDAFEKIDDLDIQNSKQRKFYEFEEVFYSIFKIQKKTSKLDEFEQDKDNKEKGNKNSKVEHVDNNYEHKYDSKLSNYNSQIPNTMLNKNNQDNKNEPPENS